MVIKSTHSNTVYYIYYKVKHEYVLQKTKPLTKYFPSGETLQSWLDCLKTSEKFILRPQVFLHGTGKRCHDISSNPCRVSSPFKLHEKCAVFTLRVVSKY